ncbi:MAG: PEP-utilizing enzyme, partial [Candidatus Moraniibacteriota bacterium]
LKDDFEWVNYAFEGEKLTLSDVDEKVKELIYSGLLKEKIVETQNYIKRVKVEKKQIIEQYKISKKDQRWFDIGADIVFIKYFRKGVFAESYYLVEFLLEEIGRRIGCSRKQVSNMLNSEVLAALKIGKFDGMIVDLRLKNSILFHDAGMTYAMPLGASKYLKVKTELGGELVMGQVAFIGRAVGIVKIVNVPADIEKMKKGDILVSRSTNPSLLSAMQKSAAFITDIGGLTCHAAIIAREMKKPCIVGTKFATQILKDGMFVEVDANKGIVKIIKK